ncbi:hypothetical protein J6590_102775 [Homalodisca vitripennis]|nr:hypothetical protein J6590_102775 [Homalodisca vitripennis]
MREQTYHDNVLVRRTTPQLVSISIKQIKDLQGVIAVFKPNKFQEGKENLMAVDLITMWPDVAQLLGFILSDSTRAEQTDLCDRFTNRCDSIEASYIVADFNFIHSDKHDSRFQGSETVVDTKHCNKRKGREKTRN